MVNGELSELEEVARSGAVGMWNGKWGIVGVGFDLMISEHSSFQIPNSTFDKSQNLEDR
jgi:hypothetical protein